MRFIRYLLRQRRHQASNISERERVLDLGHWLKSRQYWGGDSTLPRTSARLSTTCALALEGWLQLYKQTGNERFKEEAAKCADMILAEQSENGLWLSPFYFRQNFPPHPYACENLMTLAPLMRASEVFHNIEIRAAIEKNIEGLLQIIGYSDDGCFWYSPSDKIYVPNISSMASAVFAKAYEMFGDRRFLELSSKFASYCAQNQREDGGYSYFSNSAFVYVPYHALQIWELADANRVLQDIRIEESLVDATCFLEDYYSRHGYVSRDDVTGNRQTLLLKTPIWMAKAFFCRGRRELAFDHFTRAISMFMVPSRAYYFYYLYAITLFRGTSLCLPRLGSVFMRYNASFFEIGAKLTSELDDNDR